MKKCSKIFSIMEYCIKTLFHMDRRYLLLFMISLLITALIPLVNANLVSNVINLTFAENNVGQAIFSAALMLGILTALQIMDAYVMWHRSNHYLSMGHQFDILMAKKTLEMKYDKAESPRISELRLRAARGCNAVQLVGEAMSDFGANIIKMVSCAAIFTMFHPGVLLVVLPFAALNYYVSDYFQKKYYEQEQREYGPQRKIDYFLDTLLDYVAGKEIRLYSATDFFKEKYCEQEMQIYYIQRKKHRYSLLDRGIGVVLVCAQLLFLYLLVGKEYLCGQVQIGDVSLYINLVLVFSGAFAGMFGSFISVGWQGERLKDLEEYLSLEDEDKMKETEHVSEQFNTIVFEHVWFRYEGATEYALKDVNLVINQGEKLAIVGENGSGKTTLIKLLMRFYSPTKGRILVNGLDYLTLRQDEYYALFATVFQDFNLTAFSIMENIAFGVNQEEYTKVKEVLERQELWEKVSRLPQGLKTYITQEYEPEGVNFSGGERQKLSIARADFKDAQVMILDEPTSALDPIAEKKLYDKLYNMMEQKTMLMISHRLQSTAICDRILFFKDGEIAEEGKHRELLKFGGAYAHMFNMQANWYQEKEG